MEKGIIADRGEEIFSKATETKNTILKHDISDFISVFFPTSNCSPVKDPLFLLRVHSDESLATGEKKID